MDGGSQNPLESVLTYVSEKAPTDREKLREREASSWLLMATDLLPFSSSGMNPLPTSGFGENQLDQDLLAWDTTNPYEDTGLSSFSLHIPDSSADSVENAGCANLSRGDVLSLPQTSREATRPAEPQYLNQSANIVSSSVLYNHSLVPPISLQQHLTNPSTVPFSYLLLQNKDHSNSIFSQIHVTVLGNDSLKRPLTELRTVAKMNTYLNSSEQEDYSRVDSKRQKRLEKNREIAKNCRKRKKEKKEALEEEITRLRLENSRMRIQLQDDTDDQTRNEEREIRLDHIRVHLSIHDEEKMASEIREFVYDWVSFGKKRLTMAQFHLEQLKNLILPTQVTKMCMWAMQQGDEFYDEKLNEMRYGGGIWNMIASVLQPTSEQMHDILHSRIGTIHQQENVGSVLTIVDTVQKRMEDTMNSMKEQLKGIVNTLSPEQQVRFLLWAQHILQAPRTIESMLMILQERIGVIMDDKSNESSDEEEQS